MENSKSRVINHLRLVNFRRFLNLDIDIKKNIVVFVGNNALGKTSIIEAIYLAGITKSHKTNDDSEIIMNNQEYGLVNISGKNNYQIIISKNGKKTLINGVEIKRLSDYIGNLFVIMFSPEDMSLIKGSPSIRRRFIDIEIGQVNKKYLSLLGIYKKILKQRNELLKTISLNDDFSMLDVITDELITYGNQIIEYRKKFINEINEIAKRIHYSISHEVLKIEYIAQKNDKEVYTSKYKSDIMTKITSIGPHRDDINFYVDDIKSSLCSQGQQRTICLSLKLSLIEYIKSHTGADPVILLDDVLNELDDIRQKKLIEVIHSSNQVFITATNIELVKNLLNDSQLFLLTKEEIKELKK